MKQATQTALVVTVLLGLCAATFAADWPQYMGPSANGIAPDTGINKDWNQRPPRELWRTNLSDGGYAGICVADGKVFIIDHRGGKDIVRALDASTGREVWTYAYDAPGGDNFGYARSTPVFSGGLLYTVSRDGLILCLNAADGSEVWSVNMQREFGGRPPTWLYSMSALLDDGKVIVCPGNQTGCAALDAKTGETVWKGGRSGPAGYATPVAATILGAKQYVIFAGEELYGVDAATGKTLWNVPWVNQHKVNAATPIVAGNFVFFTSGYGRGCSLIEITANGTTVHWENSNMVAQMNSPIFYNNCFFGTGDGKGLMCINPRDGKLLWNDRRYGDKGGIVGVDGVIICLNGGSGEVHMVSNDYSSCKDLGKFPGIGGSDVWTTPVVSNGKLFIRNKQAMACFDLM